MLTEGQKQAIRGAATQLGVPPNVLFAALIHASRANEIGSPSNEVRALVGDAAIRLALAAKLAVPGARKGSITQDISDRVSDRNLADVARQLGLEPLVLVSAGFQTRPFPDSVLATVLEALVGGLHLEVSPEAARDFVLDFPTAQPPSSTFSFEPM